MIYNVKYVILISLISLLFLNCRKNLKNDIYFIENLSNDIEFDIPFKNESVIIILKREDKLFISSLRMLYNEFTKNYKNKNSFDDFLVMVINNNMLNKEQIGNVS